jgi:hypothetical protein
MIHLHSHRSLTALWLQARIALVLVAASLIVGCGRYRLAKDDSEQPVGGESLTAQEWLSAWAALHSTSQTSEVEQSDATDEPKSDPREATFASGVVTGTDRDRRPTSNHRSGTRLHARAVLTDQGQQGWIGWRDTERDEDCAFQAAADGATRCLPSQATQSVYFVDDSCTSRVAAVAEADADDGASKVSYALVREDNQCLALMHVYPLRGAIETPTNLFVQDHRGRCVAAALPAMQFRALGEEVPPSVFVAARQGIEGKQSRVKAVGLVADDGSISVTGFVDTELNTRCFWQGTHGTTCVPLATEVSTFADEVCSQPLLRADRNWCTPDVTLAVAREADGCGMTYYQPGEAYRGSTVYEVDQASFESREISAEEASTLQLGVRVGPEDLATGSLDRLHGNTRLSAQHWTTADGGVWFSGWYDNALESVCAFAQTGEDEWQCLPSDTGDSVLYADAACTQPITEVQGSDECGEASRAPRFVTQEVEDGSANSVKQVRRVLGERPYLATVYQQTELGCEAHAVDENRRHFDLSQPLPVSSFARGFPIVL